jgi:hypothetical protein
LPFITRQKRNVAAVLAFAFMNAAANAQTYSSDELTVKKSADGTVIVHVGGCDGKIPNCLPIINGWNYLVRLYRPRPEILNGMWTFPEAQGMNQGVQKWGTRPKLRDEYWGVNYDQFCCKGSGP